MNRNRQCLKVVDRFRGERRVRPAHISEIVTDVQTVRRAGKATMWEPRIKTWRRRATHWISTDIG